jgi:hypothetical protein
MLEEEESPWLKRILCDGTGHTETGWAWATTGGPHNDDGSGGGTAVRKRKGRKRGGEILHDTFFCPSSVFSSG